MTATTIGLLLDATGKTDWQVSQETGIHPTVISRYRSGERKPHQRHAIILGEYFGVPADTVFSAPEGIQMHDLVRIIEVAGPIPIPDTVADPTDWVD
jgi:transcriptional regulator with XRE-family HTH domain